MMNIFDKYVQQYDAWYDRHPYAYESELKALRQVLPRGGRGLEIGVGTGRFAAPLKITIGIDPSSTMAAKARERGVNTRWGYGEDLPFTDGAFDYAVMVISLCFVNDPLQVLQEIRRVLRDGGEIIIAIVDKESFLGRAYRRKKSPFYRHARFFDVRELKDYLSQTGFGRFSFHQTLFDLPDRLTCVEEPQKGFGQGGFVVVRAVKTEH